jgi:hypothetical protein
MPFTPPPRPNPIPTNQITRNAQNAWDMRSGHRPSGSNRVPSGNGNKGCVGLFLIAVLGIGATAIGAISTAVSLFG